MSLRFLIQTSFQESVGEAFLLCVSVRTLCLGGGFSLEIIHHRDTEIAQRHGARFFRLLAEEAKCD